MCTVVVRWSAGEPVRILALRDEIVGREFDDPGEWWPEHPGVVGGRDHQAGGTWCASRIDTGVTALVLNRPQKRVAEAGAPSRGVLPLLAATHGSAWQEHVTVEGMASFALVLAAADRLTLWTWDGQQLAAGDHAAGTSMVTSGGAEDGKSARFLQAFTAADFPDGWRELVQDEPARDDPAALIVRTERDGQVFATVFGELIEASPERLRIEHSRRPGSGEPWPMLEVG